MTCPTAATLKQKRKEIWATCGHCAWTWAVYGPLPAPLEVVAKAMTAARCPNCSTLPKKVFLARETDIAAALQRSNEGNT